MKKLKITMSGMIFMFVMTLLISGCASFQDNINTEYLLTQVGTMKVIEKGDTVIERSQRAERIVELVSEARTYVFDDTAPLDILKSKINERLAKIDMVESDRILANLLVNTVLNSLNERVVNGVTMPVPPDEFRYQVNTVLDWIESTAELYVI